VTGRATVACAIAALVLAVAPPARAENEVTGPDQIDIPPPPPDFGAKYRLTDEDYRRKKEGNYFTGLPLLNYDRNTGFGFGARVYRFMDGDRSDPLFAYTPYQHRFFAQAFFTTNGLQFHWLDYDAPALFGSPWRVRSQLIFQRNTNQNYFGIGERAQHLAFPGAPGTFSSYSTYFDAQSKVQGNGTTYSLYDKYLFQRPIWLMSLERSLLGGIMRSLFGFQFADASIGDYTGKSADATDATGASTKAPQAPTRLNEDCAAGLIVGCGGGWDNTVRVGLALDTRDFEPDPNSGFFGDLAADFGTHLLGSQYDYTRVMLALRGYVSPIPRYADLVLAARGVYQVQSQGAPFFSMDTFPFTEDPRTGMGGLRTLRGFRDDRFVGHVMALTNYEVRWTFAQTRVLDQRLGFIVAPFLDMGRVFDAVRLTSLKAWNRDQGVGFRIAWNLSTIIMIDYGVSEEDTGFFINFNHIF
jgi:hypothetical protein